MRLEYLYTKEEVTGEKHIIHIDLISTKKKGTFNELLGR
jgi:hypothetical protein